LLHLAGSSPFLARQCRNRIDHRCLIVLLDARGRRLPWAAGPATVAGAHLSARRTVREALALLGQRAREESDCNPNKNNH
jgi:hypothetical protein